METGLASLVLADLVVSVLHARLVVAESLASLRDVDLTQMLQPNNNMRISESNHNRNDIIRSQMCN